MPYDFKLFLPLFSICVSEVKVAYPIESHIIRVRLRLRGGVLQSSASVEVYN